jgi:FAD:protein FMN transferase
MGMPVTVAGAAPELTERVFAWLREVDARFSTYRRGSEISRLNRGELALRDAHPDVRSVLARCEALRGETGGYFDANQGFDPLRFVDPTGLVKGWAVDRAGALLDAAGLDRWCIDAGGDVLLRGGPWRVGIRHPRRRRKLAAVLELSDAAVATSGTYERGRHIVDPHTGRPPAGIASVTVVGRELATADAYATAAFAMGAAGPRWTARLEGFSALTIIGDRMLSTPGLAPHRSDL